MELQFLDMPEVALIDVIFNAWCYLYDYKNHVYDDGDDDDDDEKLMIMMMIYNEKK